MFRLNFNVYIINSAFQNKELNDEIQNNEIQSDKT